MLSAHHGYTTFGHYDKYFVHDVDWDVLNYLKLANELIHQVQPKALSIAEDMSGMPGLCRTNADGGLGFDYRLAMGIPDYWIKILKEQRDEDWNIHEMWGMLANRRWKEKNIAYAESHDQALVGDKTMAFWLMDKEMYFNMGISDQNLIVDRGIALHKIFRLLTASIGGEGYLTFIGNEFGHPEWVDFPRLGNDWSYQHARRQWSLVDNPNLKYQFLNAFDVAMVAFLNKSQLLNTAPAQSILLDADNKVIVAERGNYLFVFNLNGEKSIADYQFWAPLEGDYQVILNSDNAIFGGFNRVDEMVIHHTVNHHLSIYLTNRTALVLEKIN
jgi:1,4-alpha-glucan branching enzyme